MSRKYLNSRWCVRCGRKGPTPYLKKYWRHLLPENPSACTVADIGCGNGRNFKFLRNKVMDIAAYDMACSFSGCQSMTLGVDKIPEFGPTFDAFLANYVFMFLSKKERKQLIGEIKRTAQPKARIMVELYPAKDSECKTDAEMLKMQAELEKQLGWLIIKKSKGRFIAENT